MKYALRWLDQDKQEKKKEYTDHRDAVKAQKWLLANGAEWADIAVVVELKNKDEVE